jgi:hypothetical protein
VSRNLITLKSLELCEGDTVVTSGGTFVVVWQDVLDPDSVDVLWLETNRRDSLWLEDSVYGPVEVHRKRA